MYSRKNTPATSAAPLARCEALELRRLFSWGAIPQLIHQDLAAAQYPAITGQGEVIVSIDSGVDFTHSNLSGRQWINPGETAGNSLDDDGNGFIDDTHGWDFYRDNNNPVDEVGHGTQTTGIMAANAWTYPGDGNQYQGIAPGVKVLALKVSVPINSSPEFDSHVGQALDYTLWLVKHHPQYNIVAVNLSLAAFSQATFVQYEQSDLDQLHDLGVFIAAASGNGGEINSVSYPALDPKVFAIAGMNPDGTVTAASNRGPQVALLAPGNHVPLLDAGGSYLLGGDGTSYAAPYVTSAAALIKQVNPKLTPDAIISVLQRSGVNSLDAVSGRTFKRLDLSAALALATREALPVGPTPFSGTPAPLPGIILASNFDNGGQNLGFYDTTRSNLGGQYRDSRVDIEKTADTGGGYDVFATARGEWLKYTVNLTAANAYDIAFRVASHGAGGTFHMELDGANITGAMAIPNTRSSQSFTTITAPTVNLPAGQHVLRLVIDSEGANVGTAGSFNWFSFTPHTGRHQRTRIV